ncbi:MAG: pantoate--beta-alanine ligase, partial [Limisphaerales bacterium]
MRSHFSTEICFAANFSVVRIINSVAAMQRWAKSCQAKKNRIGLVPTMGYLHAGHISLVKRARQGVGKRGQIVLSIYVNPMQFAPNEDLKKYPRNLERDKKLCRDAGVGLLFLPNDQEMHPGWNKISHEAPRRIKFSTFVIEEKLSQGMESISRPTHFRGVTTIVAKLFNIVLP